MSKSDLVLYNNADGNYEIVIMTKAIVVSLLTFFSLVFYLHNIFNLAL